MMWEEIGDFIIRLRSWPWSMKRVSLNFSLLTLWVSIMTECIYKSLIWCRQGPGRILCCQVFWWVFVLGRGTSTAHLFTVLKNIGPPLDSADSHLLKLLYALNLKTHFLSSIIHLLPKTSLICISGDKLSWIKCKSLVVHYVFQLYAVYFQMNL